MSCPRTKPALPSRTSACHAISDTYEGVTLVIQEVFLLCRECDTPLDSDKTLPRSHVAQQVSICYIMLPSDVETQWILRRLTFTGGRS
ncbi:unnamed protein product [Danaus chrysippus]|uniref:(African queen) hypothetical protein n=1 Tax=Danaus chrysippus TaxID=151541 RepID=A0A8J2QZY3_9NEOP|nr:unnamed protein product [Danaus chrysippus]